MEWINNINYKIYNCNLAEQYYKYITFYSDKLIDQSILDIINSNNCNAMCFTFDPNGQSFPSNFQYISNNILILIVYICKYSIINKSTLNGLNYLPHTLKRLDLRTEDFTPYQIDKFPPSIKEIKIDITTRYLTNLPVFCLYLALIYGDVIFLNYLPSTIKFIFIKINRSKKFIFNKPPNLQLLRIADYNYFM